MGWPGGRKAQASLWTAFLILAVVAVSVYIRSLYMPVEQRLFSSLAFATCAISATGQLAMAVKVGWSREPAYQRPVRWLHYMVWAITGPLTLIMLAKLAGMSIPEMIATSCWNVVMVLSLLGGCFAPEPSLKWPMWLLGCTAMLFVFHALVGGVQVAASKRSNLLSSRYKTLMGLTLVLWTGYPIVWAATSGTAMISVASEAVAFALLDVLSKGAFCILLLSARPDEETSEYSPLPAY